jgi:hypothetical protein
MTDDTISLDDLRKLAASVVLERQGRSLADPLTAGTFRDLLDELYRIADADGARQALMD